jgi:hypothetical protein
MSLSLCLIDEFPVYLNGEAMRNNLRIYRFTLGLLSATCIVTTATASAQDERFWMELQRSDGGIYFTPLPKGTTPVQRDQLQFADRKFEPDWFAVERQKTDGYVPDRNAPNAERARSAMKKNRVDIGESGHRSETR